MSYIVAFINFKESSESLYPFECTRDDLVPGDKVIVRTKDERLSVAFVNKLEYLDWNCDAEIVCKLSEGSKNTDGKYLIPKGTPYKKGYAQTNTLVNILDLIGWKKMTPANKTFSLVMGKKNQTQTAFILFRKNGIDIQLHDSKNYLVKKGGSWTISTTEGKMVRNYYARTNKNLLHWIESFATDFDNNKKNLEKYFIPQGSKDKRPRDTDFIPSCSQKDESYPKDDIYDGIVSLGNGLYMDITGIGNIDKSGDFLG
jgi:hypothetical protein